VTGTVSYDAINHMAYFQPTLPLDINTTFVATVTTGVRDLYTGIAMEIEYEWAFSTLITADLTLPSVTSEIPLDGSINAPINTRVTAIFDEQMDSFSFTTTSFTLMEGANSVLGSVICPPPGSSAPFSSVTFIPAGNLLPTTLYTATVKAGVLDLAGNPMSLDFVWTFTTGTLARAAQAFVDLQSASNFAILAGSEIVSTGPSIINGDVGLYAGSSITGLMPGGPGFVNGTQYGPDDTIVMAAKGHLTDAYLDAMNRAVDAISCPGNVGGLTLAPGLYVSGSSIILSGSGPLGILTLDAQGDANAVWIFQMPSSSLTTDPGTSVVLSGGALAKNIFWQVGSSATLDTTCAFKGNILAQASITMLTGATLDGRALAQTAKVDLQSNTITRPNP